MHWLPLVAMVIASALPFPQSPLPRLVAATTLSSQTPVNHSNSSSSSSSSRVKPTSTPSKVFVDHNSLRNVSKKAFDTVGRKTTKDISQNDSDRHPQSTLEDLILLSSKKQKGLITKWKHDQAPVKAKLPVVSSSTADTGRSAQLDNRNVERARQRDVMDSDTGGERLEGVSQRVSQADSNPKLSWLSSQAPAVSTAPRVSQEMNQAAEESPSQSTASVKSQEEAPGPGHGVNRTRSTESGMEQKDLGVEERQAAAKAPEGPQEARLAEAPGDAMLGLDVGLWPGLGLGLGDGAGLQADPDLLFLDSHPRVLFSSSPQPPKHPPLLLMLEKGLLPPQGGGAGSGDLEHDSWEDEEEEEESVDGVGSYQNVLLRRTHAANLVTQRQKRKRRSLNVQHTSRKFSVCESVNDWVMDKRTAVDAHQQVVTIVPKINTQKGPLQQYFYETRCIEDVRRNVSASSSSSAHDGGQQRTGCLGVDKRQWNSVCETKQSLVRALTHVPNKPKSMGWRWIRINSSCVCVLLSRVKRSHGFRPTGRR